MMREAIIILILAGLYYYFIKLRSLVPSTIDDFRDVSPEHYRRINEALVRFEEERTGRADIHALSAHRATITKHLYELKERLSNDFEARSRLEARIREIERNLEDTIQFIRKQRGKNLEFPYPLEDYFLHLEPVVLQSFRNKTQGNLQHV